MQPGLTSTNCFMRKPTTSLALEVRSSSFLLDGVASCEAHGSQLHRWVGGAQVVHVRMRTSHCSNLVVSSLCCSWSVMGSSFKCAGSSAPCVPSFARHRWPPALPRGGGKEGTVARRDTSVLGRFHRTDTERRRSVGTVSLSATVGSVSTPPPGVPAAGRVGHRAPARTCVTTLHGIILGVKRGEP